MVLENEISQAVCNPSEGSKPMKVVVDPAFAISSAASHWAYVTHGWANIHLSHKRL